MEIPSDYSKETDGSLCLGSEPGHLMVPCHVCQLTRAQIQFQSSQQRLPYAPYALLANPGAKHVALGWLQLHGKSASGPMAHFITAHAVAEPGTLQKC